MKEPISDTATINRVVLDYKYEVRTFLLYFVVVEWKKNNFQTCLKLYTGDEEIANETIHIHCIKKNKDNLMSAAKA